MNGKLIRELVGDSRDLQVVVAAATRNLEQKSQAAATMEARRSMLVTDMTQLKTLRALYATRSRRLLKAAHARLLSLKAATLTACGGALDDEAANDVGDAMALLLDGDDAIVDGRSSGERGEWGGSTALTFASPDALIARVREHEQLRWNEGELVVCTVILFHPNPAHNLTRSPVRTFDCFALERSYRSGAERL